MKIQHEAGSGLSSHGLFAFDFEAAIKAVALALEITNGCVVTDDPDAEPDEKSWRIDHTEEKRKLADLAEAVMKSALIPSPDLRVVIASLRGCVEEPGENVFWNSAEGVAPSILESDDHAETGGIIADSGDRGGSNGDHVHGDAGSGEDFLANVVDTRPAVELWSPSDF